jgi:hypothetical protein
MTALALNYSMKAFQVVKPVINFIHGIFKSWGFAIACSRQMEANRQIAFHLKCEYPNMTEGQLIAMLNEKSIKALEKEFYGD